MDSFSPQQVSQQTQQQQQQQNAYLGNNGLSNNNGPCLDNYDPNQVLMQQQLSPYNMATVGQLSQQQRNNNNNNNNNNNSSVNAQHPSRRSTSNGRHRQSQH